MDKRAELPSYAKIVLGAYKEAGFEAYVVGGAARDIIMGKEPHDYDVATNAMPDEGLELLEKLNIKTVDTSKKHGTIVAIVEGEQVEITTYRVDGDYEDLRHPVNVTLTRNVEEDVWRRDFTMNAIYLDENGEVKDITGGVSDIENGIIRTCGEPQKRFGEDALRILRALRFSAVLGFKIDEETSKCIFEMKDLLKKISGERIRVELGKLLLGKNAASVIREYLEVLSVFVPELIRMKDFDQKSRYHDKDLLEHTLAVLEGVRECGDANLAFAALLHDVGKPDVFKIDEFGYGHMKLHHIESCKIAKRFLDDYKFSNDDKEEISELIYNHDTFPESKATVKKYMSRYSLEFLRKLAILQRADIRAHSDFGKTREALLDQREKTIEQIVADNECFKIKDLQVNGNDLIDIGVPKGREVGNVLNEIFNLVIEGELDNEKETILAFVKETVLARYGNE